MITLSKVKGDSCHRKKNHRLKYCPPNRRPDRPAAPLSPQSIRSHTKRPNLSKSPPKMTKTNPARSSLSSKKRRDCANRLLKQNSAINLKQKESEAMNALY